MSYMVIVYDVMVKIMLHKVESPRYEIRTERINSSDFIGDKIITEKVDSTSTFARIRSQFNLKLSVFSVCFVSLSSK